MAVTREAIVICLDVGPHMRIREDDDSPTALELAVECINWILQRKIFAESKDEFAIILFGTNDTENPLADDDNGEYSHICVARELQTPTWDLVKYIQNEIPPPDHPVDADFLDAIIVSLDHLARSTEGKKYAGKQLVLFSNLGSQFADDQVDQVAEAMKNGGIEFTLFGPRLYLNDDHDSNGEDIKPNGAGNLKKTEQQELGEQFAAKILEQVNGQSYALRQGLSLLSKFTTRVVRPVPWKCNFELGEKIKIPICMYVKTKKAKPKQSWKWTHAQDPNADIAMQRTYHKKDEDEDEEADTQAPTQGPSTKPKYPQRDGSDVEAEEEAQTQTQPRAPMGKELDKEDIIKGYNYGNTVIPLDKLDLDAMKYKNSEKCLKLLSFIDRDQAKRQYFMGDGCHVVFPEAADQDGTQAFTALWKAMRQENCVALVRYAHSARSAPRVGALIPSTEGDPEVECFVFVGFPFREDERVYEFPTLEDENLKPSEDQERLVDELILCMDLTQAEVDENGRRREAFNPTQVVDPYLQNLFASLAHRALYENQPLPPISKRVVATINPIDERMHLAKPVFDRLRQSFHLTKKEVKKDKRTGHDIYKAGESSAAGPAAKVPRADQGQYGENVQGLKISSVRPVEEYTEIVDKDEALFQPASEKLEAIIIQFILDAVGSQFYEKAADCIEIYRRKSIQVSKPGIFNNFLRILKRRLLDGGKNDFLLKLKKDRLGLVSEVECSSSHITAQETDAYFEEDEKPVKEKPSQASTEPDLLDELE